MRLSRLLDASVLANKFGQYASTDTFAAFSTALILSA